MKADKILLFFNYLLKAFPCKLNNQKVMARNQHTFLHLIKMES